MPLQYTNVFTLPATSLSSAMLATYTVAHVASEANLPALAPYLVRVDNEIMEVTAGVGTLALTVTRGLETAYLASVAASHASAAPVYSPLTAGGLDLIRQDLIQMGTAASLPSTTGQKIGNSYFATDTGLIRIYNGTSWVSIPSNSPVSSVFGRTGAVVATTGDYTAAQVTNAVDQTATYANPAWITSLPWSKITGAPAFITGPAGSTGQVQYNNAGAFGASANLFWDITNSRLGIGTASPTYKLDVQAPQATTRVYSTTTGNPVYGVYSAGGNNSLITGVEGSTGGTTVTGSLAYAAYLDSNSAYPLQLAANNTVAMTITSAGNVGIGTTSPGYRLDVTGSSNADNWYLVSGIVSSAGTIGYPNSNGPSIIFGGNSNSSFPGKMIFVAGGISRIFLTSNGYVGIATDPNAPLQIRVAANENLLIKDSGSGHVQFFIANDALNTLVP